MMPHNASLGAQANMYQPLYLMPKTGAPNQLDYRTQAGGQAAYGQGMPAQGDIGSMQYPQVYPQGAPGPGIPGQHADPAQLGQPGGLGTTSPQTGPIQQYAFVNNQQAQQAQQAQQGLAGQVNPQALGNMMLPQNQAQRLGVQSGQLPPSHLSQAGAGSNPHLPHHVQQQQQQQMQRAQGQPPPQGYAVPHGQMQAPHMHHPHHMVHTHTQGRVHGRSPGVGFAPQEGHDGGLLKKKDGDKEGDGIKRRTEIGDEDLPQLATTDNPTCTHNRWILAMKRKRFYIMECMTCKSLWKTKLKSTQKCEAFFAGSCPLDSDCKHPHVYSRSRLRREAQLMPGGDAAKALAACGAGLHGEDEEACDLFVPMNLDSVDVTKLAEKSADKRTSFSHQRSINGVHRSSRQVNVRQLLFNLEESRRLVVTLDWWSGFVATVLNRPSLCEAPHGFHVQPPWLESLVVLSEPTDTMRSRSLRLRWMTTHDGPINTDMSWMSSFTEPPELLEGVEGAHELLNTAVLHADPETLFTQSKLQIGQGSYGPIYAGKINDFEAVGNICNQTTTDWLVQKMPRVGIQVIDLDYVEGEDMLNRIMNELECLRNCTSPYVMRMIANVAQRREKVWVVSDSCIGGEQADTEGSPLTLADLLTQKHEDGSPKELPLERIKHMLQCCFEGLAHLHSKSWIHLNIHTRTIVFDQERNVFSLTGFKNVLKCSTHNTISPPPTYPLNLLMYTPAEHHPKSSGSKGSCSAKTDVYALGMCGVIAARVQPNQVPAKGDDGDSPLFDFLRGCIDPSSTQRSSAEEAAVHPFLL